MHPKPKHGLILFTSWQAQTLDVNTSLRKAARRTYGIRSGAVWKAKSPKARLPSWKRYNVNAVIARRPGKQGPRVRFGAGLAIASGAYLPPKAYKLPRSGYAHRAADGCKAKT